VLPDYYMAIVIHSRNMSSLVLKLLDKAGGPSVRGMLGPDGVQVFSVYDFLTIACNKPDKSSYANTTFFRLTQDDSEFKNELLTLCKNIKFPGKGQRETPCMTIRGLQRLLMILGGKVAAEFREIIEGTFTRVMAGDQSLIEVINANAASQAPVQQAYRSALAQEPVSPVLDEICLGRKREREDLLFELEIAERKTTLEERKVLLDERKLSHASKLIEHANTALGSLNALKDWTHVDERTKLQMEDYIKNVLFNSMPTKTPALTLTNGDQPGLSPTAAINVSIVARELGVNLTDAQLQRAGREMAKKYREAYRCDPPKHKQYVAGNYIPVNSYMERDRPMMEQAIREAMVHACAPLPVH